MINYRDDAIQNVCCCCSIQYIQEKIRHLLLGNKRDFLNTMFMDMIGSERMSINTSYKGKGGFIFLCSKHYHDFLLLCDSSCS